MKCFWLCCCLIGSVFAQEWQDLWPEGQVPGGAKITGKEAEEKGWRSGTIEKPQIQVYQPEKANDSGVSVLVVPGGGYGGLAMGHEGREVAAWLNKRGYGAVVLKYRVSQDARAGYHFPVPQMDARRAVRTMRAKAGEWGIAAEKVGVIGFSAGGHLTSCLATQFEESYDLETKDAIDGENCRPDFVILCYPVISMGEKYCHEGSVRNLLGAEPSADLLARNNTAKRVTEKTPPVFIVHAANDRPVPLRNSADFMSACAEKGVPVRAAIFNDGGHGFGLRGKGDSAGWDLLLETWLAER
ncbi:MAG: alpha/beta hydrolase [Verrucomicrobiales bacterium]